MEKGTYILLYRSMQTHWLWEEKPFDKARAWIDLLMSASYTDRKYMHQGELVEIKRGEVHTSILQLSERWGWSRNRVNNFLSILETDGMLRVERTPKRTTKRTVIIIEKYDDYQVSWTAKRTQKRTGEGQPKDNRRTGDGHIQKKNKERIIKSINNNYINTHAREASNCDLTVDNFKRPKDVEDRLKAMRAKRDAVNAKWRKETE